MKILRGEIAPEDFHNMQSVNYFHITVEADKKS